MIELPEVFSITIVKMWSKAGTPEIAATRLATRVRCPRPREAGGCQGRARADASPCDRSIRSEVRGPRPVPRRVRPAARTAACTEVIGDLLKSPNRPMAGRLPLPIDYRAFSLDRPPGPRPECPGATRLTPPQ